MLLIRRAFIPLEVLVKLVFFLSCYVKRRKIRCCGIYGINMMFLLCDIRNEAFIFAIIKISNKHGKKEI